MDPDRKIAAVVNPYSAGGKTARRWPEIARALENRLGTIQICFTERNGSGIGIARELLRDGYDLIIAVGGDGTANEVANGFLENDKPVRSEACFGILPLGTGGDFRRTLGIWKEIEPAIETLASGSPLLMDVGKVSFTAHDGSPCSRYFVNVASFGLGGEAASRSRNAARRLGGTAAFLWAILRSALAFQGKKVRLALDGTSAPAEFRVTNIALGNGEFHGGGLHACPKACLNDGWLEVTVIDYLNLFELLRDIRILYSDNVYRHPKVHHFRAKRIEAEAGELTQLEVDGESLGRLPIEATILPGCLRVMVPAGSPLLAKKPE